MSVYFIRQCKENLFKVGCTVDPLKRLTTLQTGNPHKLEIFSIISGGDRTLEAQIHKNNKDKLVHGEWFNLSETEVMEIIKQYSPEQLAEKTQYDLEKAMAVEPELTDFGFGVWNSKNLSCQDRKKRFLSDKESLRNNLQGFSLCCMWLYKCHKIHKFSYSSYGLKHNVEKYYGEYITNGAFIAATIDMGFKYCRIQNSPNAKVAIGISSSVNMWK